MTELLQIYRERHGVPGFWAEPMNAVTNFSFLLAATLALELAFRRQAVTPMVTLLIGLSATVGVGSFLFHTIPNGITLWLDVLPIAAIQVLFLWLLSREMLHYSVPLSAAIVLGVVGLSFALMPIHGPLNGSLFYLPSFAALMLLGSLWATRCTCEPYLLPAAAVCFALAIAARSADWRVSWSVGSHFLWHLLNGGVVYLAQRAWILHVAARHAG